MIKTRARETSYFPVWGTAFAFLSAVAAMACGTKTTSSPNQIAPSNHSPSPAPGSVPAQGTLETEFDLSAGVYNTSSLPFEKNNGYVSVSIPYAPLKPLFEKVKSYSKLPLKSRGDAHITVIIPRELSALAPVT